ncbi:hypothetical protein F5Y14DRAFT_419834 [Nemania sp. NC0429]|nr:hypothetical protein F5Y14DRAFT_419834 [Nemania sp. NC0429]
MFITERVSRLLDSSIQLLLCSSIPFPLHRLAIFIPVSMANKPENSSNLSVEPRRGDKQRDANSSSIALDEDNELEHASCLSVEPHEGNITNPLLHFLGCIKICERDNYLDGTASIWNQELKHQCELLKSKDDARNEVEKMKDSWKLNFDSEMKRIAVLRKTLAADTHDKHLVEEVNDSRGLWKTSRRTSDRIEEVGQPTSVDDSENGDPGPSSTPSTHYYIQDEYIFVPVIQFENGKGFTETDFKGLKGKFPNQKTTIKQLLHDSTPEDSLLYCKNSPERIKYFHIPSNNMIWAEETIARYYGNLRPDFKAVQRQLGRPVMTDTYRVLQDQYWRGRLHGDASSPPHARYMSHTCETISSSLDRPNDIVLFMPYLHWETSRRQSQFAHEIDNIMQRSTQKLADREAEAKRRRQGLGPSLILPPSPSPVASDLGDIVQRAQQNQGKKEVTRFTSKNALGCYLLAASRLYESMTTYKDRKLLQTYLSESPPIHPRRTLDQAYYWALNSTKKRDRDQVVYRGTTASRNELHLYDKEKETWPEHEGFNLDGRDCDICKAGIRKVSRVLMVDQLWMWVLDARTLITCFPKRYGANKQDYSGVHKSIRTNLENLGSNQPRTVFELALIVLDECTTTFFDRAKSRDGRPQVIDEFSMAIGKIMTKQAVAFERLWRWTDEARKVFRSQGYMGIKKLHIPLLDINPEGKLDREIEDIIEELNIMLRISNTHQNIVKSFIEKAEHILDKNGQCRQSFHRNVPMDIDPTHENYMSFKLRATECQDRIDRHVKDLEGLRTSAKNTAADVLHLLTMKQQQASVVQAWQAVKQSEETIKQGRTIMVFTLATIVFLPLSFLTSVFGMNNREFGDNNWKLKDQLLYIFLISTGVVFVSLLFAFSSWIRASIWSTYAQVSTKVFARTGVYTYIYQRKRIGEIIESTHKEISDIKRQKEKEAFLKKREKGQAALQKERGEGTAIPNKENQNQEPMTNGSHSSSKGWLRRRVHWGMTYRSNGRDLENGGGQGIGIQNGRG